MAKVRQDAWSHEDDLLLAETVLRHVREGSTQLNAFEEVGDKLNRTSAACGFRWNAEVRKKYDNAMDLAKRQRKDRKRAMIKQTKKTQTRESFPLPTIRSFENTNQSFNRPALHDTEELTIDQMIQFLTQMKTDFQMNNQSRLTLDQKKKENELLHDRVKELEKDLKKTEERLTTIQEDYQAFIQIMERARKMTVLDDLGSLKAPTFRMDKNGNLEQVAEGYNP